MRFISDDLYKDKQGLNLAPMVDFLFLVVAIFAVLAVTRSSLYDSEIHLAKIHDNPNPSLIEPSNEVSIVNISMSDDGKLKWLTQNEDLLFDTASQISLHMEKLISSGQLPKDKAKTKLLLHIDRDAKWEPIVTTVQLFTQAGYTPHPVHE